MHLTSPSATQPSMFWNCGVLNIRSVIFTIHPPPLPEFVCSFPPEYICGVIPLGVYVELTPPRVDMWSYPPPEWICGVIPLGGYAGLSPGCICGVIPLGVYTELSPGCICGVIPPPSGYAELSPWVYMRSYPPGCICGVIPLGVYVELSPWMG